jgi:uncharacterized protein YecT (DUF1311 family)
MLTVRAVIIIVMSAIPLTGMAQAYVFQNEPEIREECSNEGSQVDVVNCYLKKAKESGIALARAERQVRDALDKWFRDESYIRTARTKLAASSKAFVRYREAQCAFAYALGGGAVGSSSLETACIAAENNQRAAQLLAYAKRILSPEDLDRKEEQDCLEKQEQKKLDLFPECKSLLEQMQKAAD